ncbi:MAG: hydroxyacid dehydrogenase [Clostridia bacterium]|nr:hydroxyacid dehydrogenase [Clostridia bacterium]
MKIVVAQPLGLPAEEVKEALACFAEEGHTVHVAERIGTQEETACICADADIVILANMPFPDAVINQCPKLRMIDVAFTGVDHIGMEVCRHRDIVVCNASGYAVRAVSEQAVGMLLSVLRQIPAMDARVRACRDREGFAGGEIAGKNCGIIGLGEIGLATARLLSAFGARVVATSLTQTSGERAGIPMMPLAEVLRLSDVVFLHCPLHASTKELIARDTLSMMKEGAILLNMARGGVVNSADVAEALRTGHLGFYATDVFDREPPLQAADVLLSAPHTLFLPHTGYATQEAMRMRLSMVKENLSAYLAGNPVRVVR